MIDEIESELSWRRNGCWPECGRGGRLADIASRQEIVPLAFNFPDAVRVRQSCLAAVTVATMANPGCHLVPRTSLTYFQILELGRPNNVLVVHSLGYFRDSRWSLIPRTGCASSKVVLVPW